MPHRRALGQSLDYATVAYLFRRRLDTTAVQRGMLGLFGRWAGVGRSDMRDIHEAASASAGREYRRGMLLSTPSGALRGLEP